MKILEIINFNERRMDRYIILDTTKIHKRTKASKFAISLRRFGNATKFDDGPGELEGKR